MYKFMNCAKGHGDKLCQEEGGCQPRSCRSASCSSKEPLLLAVLASWVWGTVTASWCLVTRILGPANAFFAKAEAAE